MATREQIFPILCEASGPMSRQAIEEKVGESYRKFQTQLNRWVKQGLIEDKGDHHYVITEKGRDVALQVEFDNLGEDDPITAVIGEVESTQHTTGTTEYQQFLRLGKNIGVVPITLIKVTTEHVWNGGDFRDLKWVAQALQGMGIQRDLAIRWLNAWGSHLKQPMPTDLLHELLPPEARKGEEKTAAEKKGILTHDIDGNGYPVYVGEGLGALTHTEAFELAKINASAKAKGAAQARSESPGDSLAVKAVEKIITDMDAQHEPPTDETTKVINQIKALKDLLGKDETPSSGDEAAKLISTFKSLRELFGDGSPFGSPKVSQTSPVDEATKLVNTFKSLRDLFGEASPFGSPHASQSTPIQVTDKDGKPLILDLGTFIRLEEHRDKQRRDEESHETKLEIAKGFKEMLKTASTALGNVMSKEGD